MVERVSNSRKEECRRFIKMYCIKGCGDGLFRSAKLLLSLPIILTSLCNENMLRAALIFPALTIADFMALKGVINLS